MNAPVSSDENYHVVIASDSLGLPRPWNQKLLSDQPESFFRYELTYPYLLRAKLEARMPGQRLTVSHSAARGGTFKRALGMARDLFSWLGAHAVVVHFGVVDCWLRPDGGQLTSPEEFDEMLAELMANHRQMGPNTLLIVFGVLATNARMLEKEPRQAENIAAFNRHFRARCQGENVVFVDVEQRFSAEDGVVHEDGHHLSRAGHRAYADILAEILLERAQRAPKPAGAPERAGAPLAEARALLAADQGDEAAAIYEPLYELFPFNAEICDVVGGARLRGGDPVGAFEALSVAAKAAPTNASLWARAALAATAALPAAEALPYLTHAFALNGDNRSIAYRACRALSHAGAARAALLQAERFLETHEPDPQDAPIVELRDQLRRRLGLPPAEDLRQTDAA